VLLTADLGQSLVHESHRHGALPDGGRTAFDRPSPDVTGNEEARKTRFEWERWTRHIPTF
jgi:hypothetical protein